MISFILGVIITVMLIDLYQDEEREERRQRERERGERLERLERREAVTELCQIMQFHNAKAWSEGFDKPKRRLECQVVEDEEGNLIRAVGKVV